MRAFGFKYGIIFGVAGWLIYFLSNSYSMEGPSPERNPEKKRVYFDTSRKVYYIPTHFPLRLTLDAQGLGSTPLTLGMPTTGFPIELAEGEHILRIASAANAEYRIVSDNTPPETEFTFSKTSRKQVDGKINFGRGLSIQVEARDEASGLAQLFVSINGEPFHAIPSPSILPFAKEKYYEVAFYSVDQVGNSEVPKRVAFSVDTQPPQTQLRELGTSENPNPQYLSPSSHIELVASDSGVSLSSTFYRLDEGKWINYGGEIPLMSLAEGRHKLVYYSKDAVDNKESEKTFSFVYNENPPQIHYDWKGPHIQVDDIIYVGSSTELVSHITNSTNSISQTRFRFGQEPEQILQGGIHFKGREGAQTVTLRAWDRSGNESSQFVKLIVDQSPPQVDFVIKGHKRLVGQQTQVEVGGELEGLVLDSQSGIQSASLCQETQCRSLAQPYLLNTVGEKTFNILAEDRVGNRVQRTFNVRVVPAEVRRALASAQESSMQWTSHSKYGAIGPARFPFVLYISDSPTSVENLFKMEIGEEALSLVEGKIHEVWASLGRRRIKVKVPVDHLPPRTRISYEDAHSFRSGEATFYGPGLRIRLNASDPGRPAEIPSGVGGIQYSVDHDPFRVFDALLFRFEQSKEYQIRFFAFDRVGNREAMQESHFVMDHDPPKTTLAWEGRTYTDIISGSTYPRLKAEDQHSGVAKTRYGLDGSRELQTYDAQRVALDLDALADGSHRLQFYSIDHVQNREPDQKLAFRKDSTPPQIKVEFLGDAFRQLNTQFIGRHGILRITAADQIAGVAHVRWRKEGGVAQEYVSDVNLDPETSRVEIEAEDTVGNSTEWISYPLHVDLTPPQTQFSILGKSYQLGDTLYLKKNAEIRLVAQDTESGVAETQHQIENGPVLKLKKVSLPGDKSEFLFHYQSVDKVGNLEATHTIRMVVDDAPPQIQIRNSENAPIESGREVTVVRPSTVHVVSLDKGSGTREVLISLNHQAEKVYTGPLHFSTPGKYELKVRAVDWLDNSVVKTVRFIVK